MTLTEMKTDIIIKQKKGLHFITASIIIWTGMFIVQLLPVPILTKNLLTFCCTGLVLPLSYLLSKLLKSDFEGKGNPLSKLGLVMSLNQILYIVIAVWAYNAVPEKMLMIIAIIFGAHLLPLFWLYDSKAYLFFSVLITVVALLIGVLTTPLVLAASMVVMEVGFTVVLVLELRQFGRGLVKIVAEQREGVDKTIDVV